MSISDHDLASVIRGDRPGDDDLRAALAGMRADGLVLVHRDVLASIAAAGPNDGTTSRRLALTALLSVDLDLLAGALVDLLWDDRRDQKAAA